MANLILLVTAFTMASCNLIFDLEVDWQERDRLEESFRSKFQVFYKNNPLPPEIIKKDYGPYLDLLEKKEYKDLKEKMKRRFGNNQVLMAYSFIDMDGDEVSDWTWSEKSKRFIANDLDLDNDGVKNFEDKDPYNPSIKNRDFDRDGIPNHLDWDSDNDGVAEKKVVTNEMVRLQKLLFSKHGILAINQEAFHNERTLKAFNQVVHLVFGNIINANQGAFPGVRYLVANAGRKGSKTLAYYRESQSLISIQNLGRKEGKNSFFPSIIPLNFYSTLIHELAHAFEHIVEKDHGEGFIEKDLFSEMFSKKGEEWLFRSSEKSFWRKSAIDELEGKIENASGEEREDNYNYFVNSRAGILNLHRTNIYRENNILSTYSMTSPGEYFSESLASYALLNFVKNRYKYKPSARKFDRLIDIVEEEAGLGVLNLSPEIVSFFENYLELSEKLYFDRDYERDGNLRGRWIFKNN